VFLRLVSAGPGVVVLARCVTDLIGILEVERARRTVWISGGEVDTGFEEALAGGGR
jgi:hypothetical protein